MKKSKTLFVFFLVVALLCAPTTMVQASSLEITRSEDISLQETSYAVQEDTSLREQGVKHFRLPDNTYFEGPVVFIKIKK